MQATRGPEVSPQTPVIPNPTPVVLNPTPVIQNPTPVILNPTSVILSEVGRKAANAVEEPRRPPVHHGRTEFSPTNPSHNRVER